MSDAGPVARAVTAPLAGGLRIRIAAAVATALSPALVYVGLHVRAMVEPNSIDPYFYTGYLQNGFDLMQRFGPQIGYFWTRVGFILPAHLSWALLGPIPGYLAFRYALALIAVVPAYTLFRRLHGVSAGLLSVLAILTSPVVLTAWGTDYPDSAAVAYVTGALASLHLAATSVRRARLGWAAAAGILYALAVTAHPVGVFSAMAAGVAYSAVLSRGRFEAWLTEMATVIVAAGATVLLLIGWSQLALGNGGFIEATLAALQYVRLPSKIAEFHSATRRWLLYEGYLLAPPALIVAWAATALGLRRRSQAPKSAALPVSALRIELSLAASVGLAYLAQAYEQFLGSNWTLEFYLYSSVLFGPAALILSAFLTRAVELGPPRRLLSWAPVAAVLVVPVLIRPFRELLQYELPVTVVLALALMATPALISRTRRSPAQLTGAVALAVALTYLIVTGMPINKPLFPGQANYVTPDYATTLFGDSQPSLSEYSLATQVMTIVPSQSQRPGRLLLWWGPRASHVVLKASAQYLWILDALPATLPRLDSQEIHTLKLDQVKWFLLLTDTDADLSASLAALRQAGFQPAVYRRRTFTSGRVQLHVLVLDLAPTITSP